MHSKQTFAYSLRSLIICESQVFYRGIDDHWTPKALCYPLFLREWAVSQRSAGSCFGMTRGGPTFTRNYSSSLPKSD